MDSRMVDRDLGAINPRNSKIEINEDSRRARSPSIDSQDSFYLPIEEITVHLDTKSLFAISKSSIPGLLPQKDESQGRFGYREQVRQYAQKVAQALPLVAYLDNEWMTPGSQQSCAVSSKLFLAQCSEGGDPILSTLDYGKDGNAYQLRHQLETYPEHTLAQLLIAPNLSPYLVGLIGYALNVNPMVFVSALKDVWDRDETEEMNPGSLFYNESFGLSMFSYETETVITTSYHCYSTKNDGEDLGTRLDNPNVAESIDKAFMKEITKGPSKPAIKPVHPLLCPPLHKGHSGAVELKRSYVVTNRITVYHIQNHKVPIFLVLTAHSSGRTANGQHPQQYKSLENRTPRWLDRLAKELFGQEPISFLGVQVQDNGNPFISTLYEEPQAALSFWHKEAHKGEGSVTDTFSKDIGVKDLFALFKKTQDSSYLLYALNIWACRRATRALEESLRAAQERLNQLKLSNHSPDRISINTRISILRDHRGTLSRTRKKIAANIQHLKVATVDLPIDEHVQREQQLEANTLIYHLSQLQKEAEDILQANECSIQDCLFDLQIELNNAQLLESRKTIEQNASMSRLQILAFIFIPVSTVSSIFGMNVIGFANIDLWKFMLALFLVLAFSLSLAAFASIRALFSALEGAAFQHATWPQRDLVLPSSSRKSFMEVMMWAYRSCGVFAVVAFVFTPVEMFLYKLSCWIDYGSEQEHVHRLRRLRIDDEQSRLMINESVVYWLGHTKDSGRLKGILSYLFFPFIFAWAYIVHRLSPISLNRKSLS